MTEAPAPKKEAELQKLLEDTVHLVLAGGLPRKADLLSLAKLPLAPLAEAACRVREHFCGVSVDVCAIVSAKSGRCSENCRFCAQSALQIKALPRAQFLTKEEILRAAEAAEAGGVRRFSLVCSGRKLSPAEVRRVGELLRMIKAQTALSLCLSGGLLTAAELAALKTAGLTRVHNNLETSERFFPQLCQSHHYADKIAAIKAAQAVGLEVCSGGLLGAGETMEDRLDLGFTLRALKVKSVPLNLLNPLPGTPLQNAQPLDYEQFCKSAALLRFILPDAYLRLAGGRTLMPDEGILAYHSGVNALISGDMLTTPGVAFRRDRQIVKEAGLTADPAPGPAFKTV